MSKGWRVALPINTLDVPAAACFDALRLGALVSIAVAYWRSGCDDDAMPSTDDGWQAIAAASSMGWHRIKERVLIAFSQAKPRIRDAHQAAKATTERAKIASNAGNRKMAQMRAQKIKQTTLIDANSCSVPFLPVKSGTYDFGHHGHASNGQEIPHKTARGLIGASLTDKPTKT
jgi:hypothetical protein